MKMPRKEEIEELLSKGKISEGVRLKLREGVLLETYDVEEVSERCGVETEEVLRWMDGSLKECAGEARAGILRLLLRGESVAIDNRRRFPLVEDCIADLTKQYNFLDAADSLQRKYVQKLGDMIQEKYRDFSSHL